MVHTQWMVQVQCKSCYKPVNYKVDKLQLAQVFTDSVNTCEQCCQKKEGANHFGIASFLEVKLSMERN